jgi:hypothetical protein
VHGGGEALPGGANRDARDEAVAASLGGRSRPTEEEVLRPREKEVEVLAAGMDRNPDVVVGVRRAALRLDSGRACDSASPPTPEPTTNSMAAAPLP